MEHTQNLMTLLAVVLCACIVTALPAGRSGEAMQHNLSHLVKLIGKLKNLDSHRNDESSVDSWAQLNSPDSKANVDDSESLGNGQATSEAEKLAALKQGFLGLTKRQYASSYDYGLGGGRFGKRYYGDYGIGGGRFGRDVDHVDIADTSDVTL